MAADPAFRALAERARIGRFVSVGVVGAVIETTLLAVLTTTAGFTPLLAKALGAETSVSTMFLINDRWTFAEEGDAGPLAFVRRWARSHLVRATGLVIAFFVLFVLTSVVEFSLRVAGVDLWPTIANAIGIGAGMGVNYVAESLFTWRVTGSE